METFIRSYRGAANRPLLKELNVPHDGTMAMTADTTQIGWLTPLSDKDEVVSPLISSVVSKYVGELGIPYNYDRLVDEGYHLQHWESSSSHWISPMEVGALNRCLSVLVGVRGSLVISFKHYRAQLIKEGTALVFPSLFTHTYSVGIEQPSILLATCIRAIY